MKQLVLKLVKTIKTLKLYPESHGLCNDFVAQLFEEISHHLEWESSVVFFIEELQVKDGGGEILFAGTEQDYFPWVLYKNGIRKVQLKSGLTQTELSTFLDLLVNHAEDLLYYILERDFPHIEFEISEFVVLDEDISLEARQREGTLETHKLPVEEVKEELPLIGEKEILQIGEDEFAYIEREIEEDLSKDCLTQYLEVILNIFVMEGYEGISKDLLDNLKLFVIESVGIGSLDICIRLLKRLRELPDRTDISEEKRREVTKALKDISSVDIIKSLRERACRENKDNVKELLLLLEPSVLPAIINWYRQEADDAVCEVLFDVLKENARDNLNLLVSCIRDKSQRMKLAAIRIAQGLDLEKAKLVLNEAIEDEDERVRKEAIKSYLRMEPGRLLELTVSFLNDKDYEIRMVLLDSLIELGNLPQVIPYLEEEIKSKEFQDRDFLEKRMFFSALLRMGRDPFSLCLRCAGYGWREF